YFAALTDDEHRGEQIDVREAIAGGCGHCQPSGDRLALRGVRTPCGVGATAVVVVLATLPILWTQDPVASHVPSAFRAAIPGMLLFVADGWVAAGYVFVWQIALFLSLGESLLAYGMALAVAALIGATGNLFLGRHIDAGHGKKAIWYAFRTFALIVV